MMKKTLMATSVLLFIFGLNACGGGGGGGGGTSGGSGGGTSNGPTDTTPPVVTLNGDASMRIPMLENFVDPGATAEDNVDGSVPVMVYGEVDTSALGAYSISYQAYDSAGNMGEAVRTVNVIPRELSGPKDTNITILGVYSKGMKEYYGDDADTRFKHLIYLTNITQELSGISLEYQFAGSMVDSNESIIDKNDTMSSNLSRLYPYWTPIIREKRDAVNADIVIGAYMHPEGTWFCGRAPIGQLDASGKLKDNRPAAILHANCPVDIMAHEIGHLLGLKHSEAQGNDGGITPYARGYGVDGVFATIMAYPSAYNVWETVNNYSSPDLECPDGLPCGVAEGQLHQADAVRVIKDHKDDIAAWK